MTSFCVGGRTSSLVETRPTVIINGYSKGHVLFTKTKFEHEQSDIVSVCFPDDIRMTDMSLCGSILCYILPFVSLFYVHR